MAMTSYNRNNNFQDWPFSNPPPPCQHIQVGQKGVVTIRSACKFRYSFQKMFSKNSSSEKSEIFSAKHLCSGTILRNCVIKNCSFSSIALHQKCFPGQILRTAILQNTWGISLIIWSLFWILKYSTNSFSFITLSLIIALRCIS